MSVADMDVVRLHDLDAISMVHARAFPHATLTTLGVNITKKYYESQMNGPHAVGALAAIVDGEIVGYSFIVTRADLIGFISRTWWTILLAIISNRSILGMTSVWSRVFLTFQKMIGNLISQSAESSEIRTARILAIGVEPAYQRMGIGTMLLWASEKLATEAGYPRIGLSVKKENVSAVAFYERNGWVQVRNEPKWKSYMQQTELCLDRHGLSEAHTEYGTFAAFLCK